MKIGFWGLGSMGMGMAQSLVRAGHEVTGHDPRGVTLEGGVDVEPGEMRAAVICVLNAAQTEAVIDGLLGELPAGAVIVACATVPPDFARAQAGRAEAAWLHYLDAPISGGAARAAKGDLAIMASGRPEAFDAAAPVLEACASTVHHMGDAAGLGSAMKATHQILAGVNIATMAEAMVFGMTQGITPERFMEILPSCGGTSWMLENRGPHIRDGDYTPHSAVDIWPKDLGIVEDIAAATGMELPLVRAALAQYRAASAAGHGGEDDAAVAKAYAAQAGVKLPGQA
ncbi:NAD(P)-dependent oxidoreductase [Jannaschia aquimarina]|uniref:2-(Hydroxymethyl)glutarate dehydrogenase n=1 Tax=Jannaschia aquimarina TaxID=935700 RepID=A0A0D1EGE6_9RHOB|nr:NAD(P)-dependent oxidoreductase [Jannaschia aquimarina]KIT16724.1 2-(hydroxymethyl)glutarate dehydrogenase [Jannaschia aquimarina]SNS54120.1 3-hydroxyisobutyrate dehydrogenase/2-hydroxy-3-oxopropionate reductase [Jannaschia aquimarina]